MIWDAQPDQQIFSNASLSMWLIDYDKEKTEEFKVIESNFRFLDDRR